MSGLMRPLWMWWKKRRSAWLVSLEFLLARQIKMLMEPMHRLLACPLCWLRMDVMMSPGRSRVAGGAWEGGLMGRAGGGQGEYVCWVEMRLGYIAAMIW